jgi:hypothetical protein
MRSLIGSTHRAPRCGLLVIDLRNGDIVQRLRFMGNITELFYVGVIANIRCLRGIKLLAPGLEEAMRGMSWSNERLIVG